MRFSLFLIVVLIFSGCGDRGGDGDTSPATPDAVDDARDGGDVAGDAGPDVRPDADVSEPDVVIPESVEVHVTLDGQPAADVVVMQGGTGVHWITDSSGSVRIDVDSDIIGELVVTASHAEARIGSTPIVGSDARIDLVRFSQVDNEEYVFQEPGTPRESPTTAQCGHCHITINRAWYNSPHRTAAANRTVQDLFRGGAFAFDDEDQCADADGDWLPSPGLGDGAARERCFVGDGVVPTLNPDCEGPECAIDERGACADCHAPGIGPLVGGNDLRDATGHAFWGGVHCDVCHRVESVLPDGEAGVGGRLRLLRPSEPQTGPLGPWRPLIFGPSHDSPNPRMGSVQRDHYRDGTICSGCHQLDQPVLVPGATIDLDRWPDGRLPIHSTWQEWEDGPLTEAAPCNACHMPPAADDLNTANLEDFLPLSTIGVQGGWIRPPGQLRHHSWVGPRTPESGMLQLAAAIFISKEVVDGTLRASVTTRNVGPAHAIPTGEPLRSLLLVVEARCGDERLAPSGGDIVPDYGGFADRREAADGLNTWPGASAGDRVVGVATSGGWVDYEGFGPFGDGTFAPEDKGIPEEELAWVRTITDVAADGTVTLDGTVEGAEFAYRLSTDAELAGASGFGFARVLIGADGARMVPHFVAVDVVSDNRLLPQSEWTSEHFFDATCDAPTVTARLLHRPYPLPLARERGWTVDDQIMTEVSR